MRGEGDEADGLLDRCCRFIYEEAELLDTLDLDRWLGLFASESIYWLPVEPSVTSPLDTLNLVYDDRARLGDRVSRFRGGFSFSETPESRTSHMVTNLRLISPDELRRSFSDQLLGAAEVAVAGRGAVARLRRGVNETFHARMAWVLVPDGNTFAIRMKRIDLLSAQEPLPLLTFLL